MTGPTVAQLALRSPPSESLLHFLGSLPASAEAQQLYGFMLAGIVGMVAHYVVRWAYGQIEGSLWRYLFVDSPRRTLLALIGLASLAITAVSTGIFTTPDGAFTGWANVLWTGLTTGFGSDSVVNKGSRPVWSDEQRTEKGAQNGR